MGHLLTAVQAGYAMDFARLAEACPAGHVPRQAEWQQLEDAFAAAGQSPQDNDIKSVDILGPELCPAMSAPYADRSEAEQEACSKWNALVKWYLALKRASYPVMFSGGEAEGSPTKRARVEPQSAAAAVDDLLDGLDEDAFFSD